MPSMPVQGAWDTHVHAGPDVHKRKHDTLTLARRASDAGMGGLVLKNHHFPTSMVARLVADCPGVEVELASTVVLNRSVGGLNPDAVVAAAEMGVSRVELPTMTAAHNMLEQGEPRTIDLLDDDGDLHSATRTVLDEALDREMVIGTGHIGVEEVRAVIEYVVDAGGKVVVTHPEFHAARDGIGIPIQEQADLARLGVFFERCFIATDETIRSLFLPNAPQSAHRAFQSDTMLNEIVTAIEATGPKHNLISTDYGQPERASPPDALGAFHQQLLDAGVSRSELERMARENPEILFGNG